MAINKEADFIMKDGRAIYPPVISDESLKLWYDTKGKKNSDKYKDKMFDMSGNKNHGTLENFDYKNLSGYQEDSELVFDGIDDKLVLGDVEKPEIISATKNLFDPQKEIVATQNSYTLSWEVNLKPNTSYTVSTNASRVDGSDVFFDNKDTRPSSATNGVRNTTPRTLTTDSSGVVWVSTRQTQDTTAVTNIDNVRSGEFWIQLEEGSTATPYVPYIPSIRGTYQLNNNVISYGEDGSVKWVKDGKVMERKGINLVRNGLGVTTYSGGQMNYVKHSHSLSTKITQGDIVYISTLSKLKKGKPHWVVFSEDTSNFGGRIHAFNLETSVWLREEVVHKYSKDVERLVIKSEVERRTQNIHEYETKELQLINLTATFGAGNEPTLEEIQAEPDKWQWLPNPIDLVEAEELKGNILGDMEDIIDDHTRDEQSGVEVFTDKADDSLVRVEIDGKSYQHAGSGKNLFNFNSITRTVGPSLSITKIESNGFIVESTDTRSWQTIVWELDSVLEPDKTYTIKLPFKLLSGDITDSYGQFTIDGKFIRSLTKGTDSLTGTFQTSGLIKGTSKLILSLFINGFVDVGLKKLQFSNIQLEEGSTATEYEPPAPTPDYPIEIHSLNDFDVVSSVGGRNYFNKNNLTQQTLARVKYDFDDIEKEDLSYYLSLGNQTYSYYAGGGWRRQGLLSLKLLNEGVVFMKDKTSTHHTVSDFIRDAQLKIEKNSTATPWTPAPEDITESDNQPLIDKINFSLSEPLRSVGDVKDRLFRDSDGLWKIERNVGYILLDGNHTFILRHEQEKTYRFRYVPNIRPLSIGNKDNLIKSNRFKSERNARWNVDKEQIDQDSIYINIVINKSHLDGNTPSDFNNWLKNNPTEVLYSLNTPTIETLDEDFQDKLNNLRSFQEYNYVYTVINDVDDLPNHISENLKPTIHTEFLAHDHYKENRTVNNLLIWNRSLEDEELLNQNKLFHERFNMRSNIIKGEPINQEINLTQGGYVANTLSLEYTIEI